MFNKNSKLKPYLSAGRTQNLKTQKELFILIIIFLIYRLVFLTRLPIFNDEAIYLDWGWREIHLPGNLFLSLFDGKQPFLMWIFGLVQEIFVDPLIAGRLVGVLAGLLTCFGLYQIALKLFNKQIALITWFIYLSVPLFAFYERQALMESSIAAIGVWSFYFLLRLKQTLDSRYAICLGICLGLGFFIKSSAMIFYLSTIFIGIIYWLRLDINMKRKFFFDLVFSFILAVFILIPLFWQKLFWYSLAANDRYMLTFKQLLGFPYTIWMNNLHYHFLIAFFKLSPLIFVSAVIGFILIIFREKVNRKYLGVYFFIALLFYLFLTKSPSMRYLEPFLSFLSLFAAYAFYKLILSSKYLGFPVLAISLLINFLITSYQMLYPAQYLKKLSFYMPYAQYQEYVSGWPSGYGIKETVSFLKNKTKNKEILVGVRADSGNPESAMFAYFNKPRNATPVFFESKVIPYNLDQLDCIETTKPFYFVSRDIHLGGMDKFLQEVIRFNKPGGVNSIGIYKLKQPCKGKTLILSFAKG